MGDVDGLAAAFGMPLLYLTCFQYVERGRLGLSRGGHFFSLAPRAIAVRTNMSNWITSDVSMAATSLPRRARQRL